MKHKVSRTVRDLRDVDDFLKQTHQFSKKFYTVDLVGGESVRYQLNVRAIGISRDLIYCLRWMMDAESWSKLDLEKGPIPEYDPEMARNGDMPILGWIPKYNKELEKFYPNAGHVPDKQGEWHWLDLLANWDFKQVDFIEEME